MKNDDETGVEFMYMKMKMREKESGETVKLVILTALTIQQRLSREVSGSGGRGSLDSKK